MTQQDGSETQELAAELRHLVEAARDKELNGAQIGQLLRAKWPDFSPAKFGVASLREFIREHVPGVREIRRTGSDIVYGPKDAPSRPSSERNREAAPDLWRVWISPSSPYSIGVNRNTGDVREILVSTNGKDEAEIKPAPVEKHRAIAGEFLSARSAALEEPTRARLAEVLKDSNDPRWWQKWNDILNDASPQISRNWFLYREHVLAETLKEVLKASGLRDEAVTLAFEKVQNSRRRRVLTRTLARQEKPVSGVDEHSELGKREELIRLVQRVAAGMTESELRAVTLPLGLVLDSLRNEPKS